MSVWQYHKINLNEITRNGGDIDALCAAGKQGWELVTIMPHGIAYLKRPVDTDVSVPASGRRSAPASKRQE